ncbi:steroid C26-monooxygenase Cyp142 [soil metagenome]
MSAVVAGAIDLCDGAFYAGDPFPTYAWLRANAPVFRDETNGLWGVSRHEHVLEVSKQPTIFGNGQGFRPRVDPAASGGMMIALDDPQHSRRRRLVSKGFTPRQVARLEPALRRVVSESIDEIAPHGRCDFTQDLAVPLPMITIAGLLGVRKEDHGTLQRWSDDLVAGSDNVEVSEAAAVAFGEFCQYIVEVIADRRNSPRDDLVSVLCHAEVDGEALTDDELIMELLLLLVGGNETTRNVISGGLEALLAHPEQHRLLSDEPERLPVAVEELLRWVTPIVNFQRTLTTDYHLGDVDLHAGDKVLLLYGSANRDEAVFAGADRFDVTRDPNPHVAFGFGTHFCLGASLARLELRVFFSEVLRRLPDLTLVGPVERVPSSFIRGIHRMPVEFTPTGG